MISKKIYNIEQGQKDYLEFIRAKQEIEFQSSGLSQTRANKSIPISSFKVGVGMQELKQLNNDQNADPCFNARAIRINANSSILQLGKYSNIISYSNAPNPKTLPYSECYKNSNIPLNISGSPFIINDTGQNSKIDLIESKLISKISKRHIPHNHSNDNRSSPFGIDNPNIPDLNHYKFYRSPNSLINSCNIEHSNSSIQKVLPQIISSIELANKDTNETSLLYSPIVEFKAPGSKKNEAEPKNLSVGTSNQKYNFPNKECSATNNNQVAWSAQLSQNPGAKQYKNQSSLIFGNDSETAASNSSEKKSYHPTIKSRPLVVNPCKFFILTFKQ